MKVNQIQTRAPFSELFPVDESIVEAIRRNMEVRGYDQSQKIVIWDEEQVVVDGHTRLKAAQLAGIDDVEVYYLSFQDEDEALAYAIHNQKNRRNLTDAEFMRCIETLDRRKERGGLREVDSGKYQPKASNESYGKSAEETAKITGTSRTKVERARTVLDHADEKTKEEVRAGKKSIHKAYVETQQRRKKEPTAAKTAGQATTQPNPWNTAWLELKDWRDKYKGYTEFSDIFDIIDRFEPKFIDGTAPEADAKALEEQH